MSGAQLNELSIRFFDRSHRDAFLDHYWSLAQHVTHHPLLTVTKLHLSVDSLRFFGALPDSLSAFLDLFPNVTKLNCVGTTVCTGGDWLAQSADLIIAFLEKYHATVGDPKLLHVEGKCSEFPEEVVAERIQGRIGCHFQSRVEHGKNWLVFQKANAIFEVELNICYDL